MRALRAAHDRPLSRAKGRLGPRLRVPERASSTANESARASRAGIDAAIGALLLEMLTPMTLEVALAVQQELQQRLDEADRLRRQQVERARYEADLAQERFLQVDPNNRLVADALEADWNEKLRGLTEAQEQYERQSQADRAVLDQESRSRILALATDFPNSGATPRRRSGSGNGWCGC